MSIPTSRGALQASAWGRGFTILLVHGWEGSRADMVPIATRIGAQAQAIAVDLPAHGASPGEAVSVPDLAEAVLEIADRVGPVSAVVAHSVGAVATMAALSRRRFTSRVAMVGAPARYVAYARAYAAAAGLDERGTEAVIAELYALGVDLALIDAPRLASELQGISALFLHSRDDRVASIQDARETVAAWSGARLIEVEGLGHHRLLREPEVIRSVCDFVCCTSVGMAPSAPS